MPYRPSPPPLPALSARQPIRLTFAGGKRPLVMARLLGPLAIHLWDRAGDEDTGTYRISHAKSGLMVARRLPDEAAAVALAHRLLPLDWEWKATGQPPPFFAGRIFAVMGASMTLCRDSEKRLWIEPLREREDREEWDNP